MQHHRHAGLAGRLTPDGDALRPHPDATHADARMAWVPVATRDGREVEALEGLLCVPTRAGAMRVAAVPHVVEGLTIGDEIAVGDWDGEPLARGELALALAGTVRVVCADERLGWRGIARLVDDAAGGAGSCWHDVIGAQALASSVPRAALASVFAALDERAANDALRWEYVTPARH